MPNRSEDALTESLIKQTAHIRAKDIVQIALIIGALECGIMLAFDAFPKLPSWIENGIDTIAISILSALIIYFRVILPQRNAVSNRSSLLMDFMEEGIVFQGEKGAIIEHNRAALRILGLSADELSGRTSLDTRWRAVHEDGSPFPGAEHPASVAQRTGKTQTGTMMGIEKPNGEKSWIQINSVPIYGAVQGVVTGALTTFSDVTERHLVTERLRFAMRALKFGIWDWDYKNNRLIWDEQMYEVFGVKKSDFKGDYDAFEKTLHPEDGSIVAGAIQAAIRERGDFKAEFRILSHGGEVRRIAAEAKIFYSESGEALRLIGANWDVTEIREREAQSQEGRRLASLGEMAAGVAHEVNNPLAVIASLISRTLKGVDSGSDSEKIDRPALVKTLEIVQRNVHRISGIVSGLRSFSRDSKNDPFTQATAQDILQDALTLCSERIHTLGIQLELNLEKNPLFLKCRPNQVAQVLVNLLNNARDAAASSDMKRISLSLNLTPSGNARFLVTDSGSGVSPEIESRIFDPFFTTKPMNVGTGLGLSISIGIAKDHGGTLRLDRSAGESAFALELPIEKNEAGVT